jgi:uncharacterized membrane protein YqjE
MDAEPTSESGGGLLESAKRVWKTLREALENRLDLFLLELKEERIRAFDALLLAATAVVCAAMVLVLATFSIVILCWENHLLLALGGLIAAYSAGAGGAFWTLRRRLRQWESFKATRDQFKKDRECF